MANPIAFRQMLTASGMFFAAQILAKLVNFAFFVLLARWLNVEHFGMLTYAVAVAIVVDIIADMGMSRLLLRDVSRRPMIASRRLALLLPLKATLGMALYLVAVAVVIGSNPKEPITAIFIIIGFTVLFTGATMLAEQILHSRGLFGTAAAAHLTLALTQLGGAAAVHALGGETIAIAVMMVVGNIAYLAVILTGLHRCGVRLHLRWHPRIWTSILRLSTPFAAVGILILLSFKVEFFVLGKLADASALGQFGGASRLFDAALMAPITLCAVLTPRFIERQSRSITELTVLYGQSVRIMLSFTVFVALFGAATARDIVYLLLPQEFAFAGDILRLMFFGYPAFSIYILNVSIMLGAKSQRFPTLLLVALVTLQTAIAYVLIGRFSELGAAEAMVVSATLSATVSALFVRFWLLDGFIIIRAALPPFAGLISAVVIASVAIGTEGLVPGIATAIIFAVVTAMTAIAFPSKKLP